MSLLKCTLQYTCWGDKTEIEVTETHSLCMYNSLSDIPATPFRNGSWQTLDRGCMLTDNDYNSATKLRQSTEDNMAAMQWENYYLPLIGRTAFGIQSNCVKNQLIW